MKDFWKKLNRQPETDADLDTGYDSDYYVGSYPENRGDDRRADDRRNDDRRAEDRRYDDRRVDDRYADDRRYDDRRADDRYADDRRYDDRRYDDRYVDDRRYDDRRADDRGYYDDPAPIYRDRVYGEEPRREEPAPAPVEETKPEHLYFTPATYKDCREAIVKGMASGHIVVIRVSKLDTANLLRLFDYIMGAALALEADMFRTSAEIIVLAPNGVEVDEDELEIPEDEDEDEYDEYDDEYEEYEDGYGEEDSDEDAE